MADLYSNLEGSIQDERLFDAVNVVSNDSKCMRTDISVVSNDSKCVRTDISVVSNDSKCVLTDISYSFTFSLHCSY